MIVAATAGSLVLAFTISAFWFGTTSGTSRFEPAVETLGLLAGITGVVAERRAAARERREQALRAVREELEANKEILNAPPFAIAAERIHRRHVYPRLHSSAVDAALSSAVLSVRRDDALRLSCTDGATKWAHLTTS